MNTPVVFKIPLIIVALPIMVTLIAGPTGWLLFRRNNTRPIGLFLMIIALLAIPFAPSMYADRVVLTPTEIYQTTGIPWAPTRKGFVFKDVEKVRITRQESQIIWEVSLRDGSQQVIDPGDLWDAHTNQIIPMLQKHGIRVHDRR